MSDTAAVDLLSVFANINLVPGAQSGPALQSSGLLFGTLLGESLELASQVLPEGALSDATPLSSALPQAPHQTLNATAEVASGLSGLAQSSNLAQQSLSLPQSALPAPLNAALPGSIATTIAQGATGQAGPITPNSSASHVIMTDRAPGASAHIKHENPDLGAAVNSKAPSTQIALAAAAQQFGNSGSTLPGAQANPVASIMARGLPAVRPEYAQQPTIPAASSLQSTVTAADSQSNAGNTLDSSFEQLITSANSARETSVSTTIGGTLHKLQRKTSSGQAVTSNSGATAITESGDQLSTQKTGLGTTPGIAGAKPEIQTHSLASDIAAMRLSGKSNATLSLRPSTLGQVEVRLKVSQSGTDIELIATSDSSAELLQQSLPKLRAQLHDSGVSAGALTVSTGSADADARSFETAHQQNDSSDSGGETLDQSEASEIDVSPLLASINRQTRLLDLRA